MRHRIASYIALRTDSVHFWPRAVTAVAERVRIASPMRARHRTVRVIRLLTLLSIVLAAGPASAFRRCGDDVDGRAVPCACGDLLVGSHRLGPTDPVTTSRCAGNGLVVDGSGPVTLDLGGRTIAGNGQGVGVLVVHGTLSLVGPGSIERFETGVRAEGDAPLARVTAVRVADNRLDGLAAHAEGYALQGSVAEGDGRDGFALDGAGYALDGNSAAAHGPARSP